MKDKTFIEQDMQYHSGICMDNYNGEISICVSQTGKDGKVYLKWCYPQNKERKPSEKPLPWKVSLGSKSQAIEILEAFLQELKGMQGIAQQPAEAEQPETFGSGMPDDQIPF